MGSSQSRPLACLLDEPADGVLTVERNQKRMVSTLGWRHADAPLRTRATGQGREMMGRQKGARGVGPHTAHASEGARHRVDVAILDVRSLLQFPATDTTTRPPLRPCTQRVGQSGRARAHCCRTAQAGAAGHSEASLGVLVQWEWWESLWRRAVPESRKLMVVAGTAATWAKRSAAVVVVLPGQG